MFLRLKLKRYLYLFIRVLLVSLLIFSILNYTLEYKKKSNTSFQCFDDSFESNLIKCGNNLNVSMSKNINSKDLDFIFFLNYVFFSGQKGVKPYKVGYAMESEAHSMYERP